MGSIHFYLLQYAAFKIINKAFYFDDYNLVCPLS